MSNKTFIFLAVVIVLITAAFLFRQINGDSKPVSSAGTPLPGLLASESPWPANSGELRARLNSINMPALTAEGEALHTHQHLSIFIYGQAVAVPANIGIPADQSYIAPIHTHDSDAIIHVESPEVRVFTLGQFFDIWGLKLAPDCLGAYCDRGDRKLKVFINGQEAKENPRDIPLREHDQVTITYGRDADLPKPIPASYDFGPNL